MYTFATALLTALPLAFGSAGPSPVGIDEKAPVITRDDIVIDAPLDRVWRIQTDVDDWPAWQPAVSASVKQTPGPLRPGSSWVWSTEGLENITSTVKQVRPKHRIVWGGPAQGITAVHVWTFTQAEDGVHVHTEESWTGEPVTANTAHLQQALDASLDHWLHNLKQRAEQRPGPESDTCP
ncbi:SRPBCC family protein [Streptomyces swartbergensis]|uniref:Shy6-polyketide cyclase n=1 Tax=Streptomyces swartbergensis TaxID=487165 RepID=A0A243RZ12_9ACTN|nr:SRPBCC family protein [Streptomyces swartbergensis]OUD00419.1 Shy6-polyketide cyclase [Streptomyces swartbergensis]